MQMLSLLLMDSVGPKTACRVTLDKILNLPTSISPSVKRGDNSICFLGLQ